MILTFIVIVIEWTGEELTACSLYGIRVYPTGAVLNTHVDRIPLVASAIINVDQDLDEPWYVFIYSCDTTWYWIALTIFVCSIYRPLEVYGHDGKATNVTMEPGDMILYESHSVLHGTLLLEAYFDTEMHEYQTHNHILKMYCKM
jgi:hypothetical protein